VAYVFQNPDEQLFHQQVWGEVAFGPKNLGYSPEQVRIQVEQALDFLGLGKLAQINPRDLGYSGRKRVALASAIAMQTPVVVFDEPTAGLDARELEQLSRVISVLHHERKTILMISHDMDFLAENFNRCVLMHQGKIVLDQPTQQFFAQTQLVEEAGILAPQITRLSQHLGQLPLAVSLEQFIKIDKLSIVPLTKPSLHSRRLKTFAHWFHKDRVDKQVYQF